MKKYLSSILILAVIAGISGCGDNKTKDKLVGTAVLDATTAGGASSFLASPQATSMTALYKTAFVGAGAGNFSMSMAPGRHSAPAMMRAPSGDEGVGLGTPDANGEYSIADTLGMTVKIKFKFGSDTVYMDFTKVFSGGALYLYVDQALTATTHLISSSVSQSDIISWFTANPTMYIASPWIRVGGAPLNWYATDGADLQNGLPNLQNWMFAHFPDSMVNTVSGSVPGGTLNITQTTAMPSSRPSDANPATMTGSGTITFTSGEVWTLATSMSVGTSGPIGGAITYTSTTGETGTMTFNANGTMDGVQKMGATTVGTIHINADGTGTYTDKDGKSYVISGARPR